MSVTEKIAFLKGLIEGTDLDLEPKKQKILDAIIDVLSEMANSVGEIDEDMTTLCDEVEDIYGELDSIEDDIDELFGEEDDDEQFMYDVTCANCGETVCVDEDTVLDGEMVCPNCGETIEFDLQCDCADCAGEDDKKECQENKEKKD
ncbi:MAG: hypothetical protein RR998_00545 [Oscillospiraceae bacterium]